MWGQELVLSTTDNASTASDWSKSYTNVVLTTYLNNGEVKFASKKACGASSNVSTISLSSADSYYFDISLTSAAASNYTLEKVVLRVAGNSTGTTTYTAPLFYSTSSTFDVNNVAGVIDIAYTGYDNSCDDNEYIFPNGTKSCRLYRRAKYTQPNGEEPGKVGTGSNYSCSNQTLHITYLEVYLKSSVPATTYTVTYKAGLGIGGDVVDDNATTVADCSFTYEGKKFTGWNTKSDGTGTPYAVGDAVTEPLTLYAQWATTYVITYNKGANGTGDITAGEKIEGTDFTLSSERFTRDGFVQVGWSTSDGGEKVYDMGGVYANDAAIDLYPVWVEIAVYEATFACGDNPPTGWTFSNDGFGSDTKATVAYVCKFVENNIKTPKQDGIADDYVAFAKNTKAVATYDLGAATTVASLDITLYGGSGSAFDEIIEYVGEDGTTVKKKYTNSLSAGNWKANEIKKNDVVADVRYIKVYGASKWVVMSAFSVSYIDLTPKYTLSFNKGEEDATGTMASVEYKAGATITIPNCEYNNSGKAFAGWSDGTNIYAAGSEYTMPASNTTFTAQWIEETGTYDITYVSDHGTAPDLENAGSVVLAELSESGWAHKGWTADVDVTVDAATVTAGTLIANGKTAILASDVTFTAVWKAIFTVTFDSKGGSSVDPIDVEDGASLDAAPADPTKTDYVFQGWSETDGGAVVADITALTITDNKTLYAKWALDVQVTEIVFSNSFKGWIHDSQVEVFYMEGESAPTITSYAGKNLKAEGGVVISGDKIIATGTDDSEIEFALTMTAITPLTAAGEQTFDGTEGYVKTRHAWTSERKWKLSKYSTDGRVTRGETSLYIFLGAAESVTLDWGAQKVTDDVAVYVNGTFVKNIGKDNNSAIPLTGGNNMVALYSLQTSGDIWLNGLSVVAYVPTTGVALTEREDAISSKTIWEGTNFTLTATVTPDNASDKTITWTSSDNAIATVVNGVVTGVAASATPATITATTVDGVSATCVVTVTAAPTPSVEPTIITQPAGANYYEDATIAALEVVATGSGDLSYQWYLGSDEIDGATAATYTPTVSAIGSYVYHCVVTHTEAGHLPMSVASNNATITIAEDPAAIKLLNGEGEINTTDFITGVTKGKVTISGVEYNSATFGGTQGAISGVGDLKKFVQYNAKTNKTKIQISLYNSNNSAKEIYLQMITEGETTAVVETLQVDANSRYTSEYYEYNNEKNRSVYITTNSTDVQILQVKVIESGETTLKKAGEVGYSLNFNKGRVFGKGGSNISFEGLNATFSSDYKPINSTEARIKSTNISFNIASPVLLKVTTSNDKKYYVSQESNGTDNATEKTGTSEFELKTIGTWYVKADASEVKITKIEFLAPKCDAPVFNALANSDICSGDLYVALDGTGTVTDEGTITYKWYAEGGTEVLAETKTYTPTADGSYYVVATNSLAGYTDNVVQSEVVTVTTHSSAAITTAPENVRQDVGTNATLTVVATGKNVTYQWYTCEADGNNAMEIVGAAAASYEVTVGTGVQYYKVVVSSDCGTPVEAVVKVEEWTELPLADVTSAITWDFSKAVTAETTLPSGDAEIVLANVAGVALNGEFESNKLKVAGTRLRTTYIQAKKLMFHATIPGKVTIEFSNTGNNKEYDRILYVNGVETTAKSKNQDHVTYSIVVPAGDVVIQAWEKAAQPEDETWNLLNIYSLSFSMADYIRTGLTVGSLGTICLPSNVPAGHAFGATFYELKGKEPQYGKIVFDEVTGELVEGKPYLFQAQSDVLYCFYGTESVSDPDNSGAMKGTFVDMTLTDLTNIYYFAQKALWSCVDLSSLSVPANRAYVKMDEMPVITESNPAPGVRRITLGVNGQQVATGVDQVQGGEAPTKMIINGQLFILRGEKMYDAQGKLVK